MVRGDDIEERLVDFAVRVVNVLTWSQTPAALYQPLAHECGSV